jgi:hypothetical protein
MSLQTRLAALITAIGADVKAIQTSLNTPAPSALLYKSANGAAIAAGGNAVVTFDQELRDSDNFHAVNASALVATKADQYIVGGQISLVANPTGGSVYAYIRVTRIADGSIEYHGRDDITPNNGGCNPMASIWLAVGDKCEIILFNSSTANVQAFGGTLTAGTCMFHMVAVRGAKGDRGDPGAITTNVPLVNTLPVVPVDQEEVYYQNAAMAALGIMWHLRYRAGSGSAYKWEYLGGSSLQHMLPGADNIATGGDLDAATVGPILQLPLSGDYEYEFGLNAYFPGATANTLISSTLYDALNVAINSGNEFAQSVLYTANTPVAGGSRAELRKKGVITGRSSGSSVKMKYNTSDVQIAVRYRYLFLKPVRVAP